MKWIERVPVQLISLAILITNLAQLIYMIVGK